MQLKNRNSLQSLYFLRESVSASPPIICLLFYKQRLMCFSCKSLLLFHITILVIITIFVHARPRAQESPEIPFFLSAITVRPVNILHISFRCNIFFAQNEEFALIPIRYMNMHPLDRHQHFTSYTFVYRLPTGWCPQSSRHSLHSCDFLDLNSSLLSIFHS